ncbi:MAG: Uma2 family endonuclease [Tildeniella nuda ZEHNDER 1965/U140]|jgi:Uma2 family endonuclease|nr:Uma2 family endonuclease [Tildeniella nuda ZEHNDER 1965/U140]
MAYLIEPLIQQTDQQVVLFGVSWQQYENLLATLGDFPGLRMTYLEGGLELLMPSSEHEMLKKVIARLLERYAEELDIPLHGYGSTTFRKEAKARGLEPDECYCIGSLKDIPDLAIEVILTSGGLDKLDVYKGLEIPEVLLWQNNQLVLYDLRGDSLTVASRSQFLPDLDIALLARYVTPQEQPQAVKSFISMLRQSQYS